MKPNNVQPGQTQHSVASDLALHCLPMSYLQIFRQLITYANSLDPGQAQLVRTVLSSKRKIIHERKKEDYPRKERNFWRGVSFDIDL